MAFSSISFLSVFLPVVLVAGLLSARHIRLQNACLLVASLLFYAFGDAPRVLLLLFSAAANGFIARQLVQTPKESIRRLWIFLTVLLNMGMLFAFKYAGFAVRTLNGIFALALPVPDITLPIGISFFTFQAMSYVMDVYRQKTAPAKSYGALLLYLSLFPQLVAGPIIKWQDMEGQLLSRSLSALKAARGMRRFIAGLCKKVLLADTLARAALLAFSAPARGASAPLYWLGAICYTLQIYLDFSGYCDMAVGLGRIFGFTFPENFSLPLRAASMRDFWRRWHMTLTAWFREYLYYPLGGNRKGPARTSANLMLVFLFTGLWHGANWTFIVWGLWNGALVTLERTKRWPFARLRPPFAWLYTMLSVILGFTLFRADSLAQAAGHLSVMLRLSPMTQIQWSYFAELLSPMTLWTFALALVVSFGGGRFLWERLSGRGWLRAASYATALLGLFGCYAALVASGYHPFIYFQF